MSSTQSKSSKESTPPKALYEKSSLLRNYPFQYGKEYDPDYQRNPKPKPSIVDPKIFPTGKDDGKGPGKILKMYVGHALNISQRKHQTQEIRLQHFTDQFIHAPFDEKLHSVELNNIPLASSISIQKSLNKPDVSTDQKKFFVQLNNRLKTNDGLLIYARLQNCNITDSTLKFLCAGLSRNERLKILMLHNNFISDKGLELLCVAVRNHPSLHTLWIGANRITDFGVKSLAVLISENKSIKELNISNQFKKNSFSKEEEDIRPYLTYISADYLANHLKKGSLLSTLVISHQKLYDDGAILLYHSLTFCQLRSLNLTDNYIGNKSCLILQNILIQNPFLEQLILAKNQISDNGAIALSYGLAYNNVLTLLDLSENEIERKGLFALFRTVQFYNTTLQSLITVKNKYDDNRAECIASTRNSSVFTLGISKSMSFLQDNNNNNRKDEPKFLQNEHSPNPSSSNLLLQSSYRPSLFSHSTSAPTIKELRRSLLLNPKEDSPILDEIQTINTSIESINITHGKDGLETPKVIAKSLSKSFLVRSNTEKLLLQSGNGDDEEDDKEEAKDGETPLTQAPLSSKNQKTKKSFVDFLQSPFHSEQDSISPIRKSVSVPGVGIYGQKPVNLASIREEPLNTNDNNNNTNSDNHNNNNTVSIQAAIAQAVKNVENSDSSNPPAGGGGRARSASVESLVSSYSKEQQLEGEESSTTAKRKAPTRMSKDLGKITGIPEVKSIGIRPIRTHVGREMDSGQHLMYLRVATEADPEDARPYSMIKIGLDRMAERERIRKERQKPEYKEVRNILSFG
jgi:Ran GTPase-activating protein (RanGAP) involved in mRNA processing and transport